MVSMLGLGLLMVGWPMLSTGFERVPGGPADARLVHYTLEHGHRFVMQREHHTSFWDPPLFFPARGVATYTDTMVSFLPFYSPWRWIGLSPVGAFQAFVLTIFILNFLAAFWSLRRLLEVSTVAAGVGAFFFAFAAPRLGNVLHPQMLPWFFWVLALHALARLLQDADAVRCGTSDRLLEPAQRRGWIAVFVGALVAQAYGAFYPFFFFVFAASLGVVLALGFASARATLLSLLRRNGVDWAWAAAMAALFLAPLASRYLSALETLGTRPLGDVHHKMPRAFSWILSHPENWLYGGLWEVPWIAGNESIFGIGHLAQGVGLLTLLIAALGLWHGRHRPWVRHLSMLALALVVVTTRWPGDVIPWDWIYHHVPGSSVIRAMYRFAQCLIVPLAVGLAIHFERLIHDGRHRWALLLFAAMALEQGQTLTTWDREAYGARVTAIAEAVGPGCGSFYVVATGRPDPRLMEDAMWASMTIGVPTLNGRYGNLPESWDLLTFIDTARPERRKVLERRLHRWLGSHGVDPATTCLLEADTVTGEVRGSRLARVDDQGFEVEGGSSP